MIGMSAPARITPQERELLIAGLLRFGPIEPADLPLLDQLGQLAQLRRGEHLLRGGERATRAGLVLQGLLREYFLMTDGVERTKAFVQAGEHTGSLADLLSGQPSRAFIVAEEPARVLLFDYATLRGLADQSLIWTRWTLRMVEHLFIHKAEREYELLGLDAEARYAACAERYPGLEARVAARHVASYLGITPVHLSRLRRKRREHERARAGSRSQPARLTSKRTAR